jgi:hypothetical protein
MKNIKLGYGTTKEEWKELIDQLTEIEGLTITYIAETDQNGLFSDSWYMYVTVEYNNQFYYIQRETYGSCFQVTPKVKINPWEYAQADFSFDFTDSEKLIEFIKTCKKYDKPLTTKNGKKTEVCPINRIYLTDGFYNIYKEGITHGMDRFKSLFGYREKTIFDDLVKIENIMHTKDYKVLRFYDSEDNTFEYECNSKRITG